MKIPSTHLDLDTHKFCLPWNMKGNDNINDILLYVKLIEKLQTCDKTPIPKWQKLLKPQGI